MARVLPDDELSVRHVLLDWTGQRSDSVSIETTAVVF
jgi:hypothetical protein